MITCTCHICGTERPDELISVVTSDISARFDLPAGHCQMNTRYCNDNPACHRAAEDRGVQQR